MNMNTNTRATTAEVGDDYMKSKEGYFVAWSLATPGHQFGEWSLLAFDEETEGVLVSVKVRFVRALSGVEIAHIQSQSYLWWGMKLENEPWALIKCCASQVFAGFVYVPQAVNVDPMRATGV